MTALVVRGDARNLPLPNKSVDLIVTSPPYFGLRSYQDGGEHYAGQIGAEATPREFIGALLECTREWMRVLKPEGSLWLNLGDKSAGGGMGAPAKSLMGLPWRYAIGCIDDLGLILRAEVIWSKPNPLPDPAKDRVSRSHEQWFHLVKQSRYFAAVDEIREPATECKGNDTGRPGGTNAAVTRFTANPLGRLPRSVWEIATQPLKVPAELNVDHFAAFPTSIPRRIILGWSPSGVCAECGEGRRPITERASKRRHNNGRHGPTGLVDDVAGVSGSGRHGKGMSTLDVIPDYRITGYACACPEPSAPTRPAVVLDPFGGTGTTSLVASTLGRRGISVDMSADYCRLAQWRTTDPGERARALGLPKPPPQVAGQADLFGEVVA